MEAHLWTWLVPLGLVHVHNNGLYKKKSLPYQTYREELLHTLFPSKSLFDWKLLEKFGVKKVCEKEGKMGRKKKKKISRSTLSRARCRNTVILHTHGPSFTTNIKNYVTMVRIINPWRFLLFPTDKNLCVKVVEICVFREGSFAFKTL